MTRYSYSTCLSFGSDRDADFVELGVTISYSVLWGSPEAPPAYDHGGLPAEAPEVDGIRVDQVDGTPPALWSAETVAKIEEQFASGDFVEDLIASANEQEIARREDAADARRGL